MDGPKFTKDYVNKRQYLYDVAATSDKFDASTFDVVNAEDADTANLYLNMAIDSKGKTSEDFDVKKYELLSGDYNAQMLYLQNAFYRDKNETETNEKGETYNVYNATKEYLNSVIETAERKKWYKSLNDFEKFMTDVGLIVGDVGNTIYGIIDNVTDAMTMLMGTSADLITFGQFHDTISEGTKYATTYDWTGTDYIASKLDEYKSAASFDKKWFTNIVDQVSVGIANMLPMLIPGAGQIGSLVYGASMFGGSSEEAIRKNPDIDLHSALAYATAVTAVEYGTEALSGKLFGGLSTKGALMFGKTAGRAGGILKNIGLDFASEFFEEFVSEFMDSVLDVWIVKGADSKIASFTDCFYAGLIGGITGAIMSGANILSTKNLAVTKDGQIINYKEAIDSKQYTKDDLKKLSKVETMNYLQSLQAGGESLRVNTVDEFFVKYAKKGLTKEEAISKHESEYNKAVKTQEDADTKVAQAAACLAKLWEWAGVENFQKATEIAQLTRDAQARLVRRYVEYNPAEDIKMHAIESALENVYPDANASIVKDMTPAQLKLQEEIRNAYGIDVYFADYGSAEIENRNFTLLDNTVVLDAEEYKNPNAREVAEQTAKRMLIKTLQTKGGIVNAENLKRIQQCLSGVDAYEGVTSDSKPIGDMTQAELNAFADQQADILMQLMLFDDLSASKVFAGSPKTFKQYYKEVFKQKNFLRDFAKKTELNKLQYHETLKIIQMYNDVVVKTSPNAQYAEDALKDCGAEPETIQQEMVKYDSTGKPRELEHYLYKPVDMNSNLQNYLELNSFMNGLTNNKFNFNTPFNEQLYNTDVVNQINNSAKNPNKGFKYNLQEYLIDNYGMCIDEVHNCFVKVTPFENYLSSDFAKEISDILDGNTSMDILYATRSLGDIFESDFTGNVYNEKTGVNLSDFEIEFVQREGAGDRGHVNLYTDGSGGEITIYIDFESKNVETEIAEALDSIYHETQHIIANWYNMYQGGSPETISQALRSTTNTKLISEFYEDIYNEKFTGTNRQYNDYGWLIYECLGGEMLANSSIATIAPGESRIKFNQKASKSSVFGSNTFFDVQYVSTGTKTKMVIQGYGNFSDFRIEVPYSYSTVQSQRVLKENKILTDLGFESYDPVALSEQGFSDDFIDLVRSGKISKKSMSELLTDNKIGNEQASNKIVDYLYGDNKYMKSFEDVDKVISYRDSANHTKFEYSVALQYYINDLAKQSDNIKYKTEYDILTKNYPKTKELKMSELKQALGYLKAAPDSVIADLEEKLNRKLTDKQKSQYSKNYVEKHNKNLDKKYNQYFEAADKTVTALDKAVYEAFLKEDYDGSLESTRKIINDSIRTSETVKTVSDTIQGEGDDTFSLSDLVQYEQYQYEEQVDTDAEESIDHRFNRILNTQAKELKDFLDYKGKTSAGENSLANLEKTLNSLKSINTEYFPADVVKTFEKLQSVDWFIENALPKNIDSYSVRTKLNNESDRLKNMYGVEGYNKIIQNTTALKESDMKKIKRLIDKLKLKNPNSDLLTVDYSNNTPSQNAKLIDELNKELSSSNSSKQNIKEGEKADEYDFGTIQKESRREVADDGWGSKSKEINENVRTRLSRVLGEKINSDRSSYGDNSRLLKLTGKENTFDVYENINPDTFRDCFEITRAYLPYGELVDLHDVEDSEEHGIGYKKCECYLSKDGLSGFAITPDGDLISVFNGSEKRGFLRAISPIIREKVKTLDCFISYKQNLQDMYSKLFGFKTASVMDYNMKYDHDQIAETHNKPKVAFMVNTTADVQTKNFIETDYDGAKAYQMSFANKEQKTVKETKLTSKKPREKKTIKDTSNTIADNALSKPKTSEKKAEQKANQILAIAEDLPTHLGTTQGVGDNETFKSISIKMYNEYSNVFTGINSKNYEEIREILKKSGNLDALDLFDFYCHSYRALFKDSNVNEAINRNMEVLLSRAGRSLGLQSKIIHGTRPITHLISELARDGYTTDITNEMISEYDSRLANKDAHIAELEKQIEDMQKSLNGDKLEESERRIKELEEKLKTSKELNAAETNKLKKELSELQKTASELQTLKNNAVEQATMMEELKKKADELDLFKNGTNAELMDWLLNNIDAATTIELLAKQTDIQKNFLDKLITNLEKSTEAGAKVGIIVTKDGEPVAFAKQKEHLVKILSKLRNYRMWAMLSSPTTWVRNWVDNKAMQGLDVITNSIERMISKQVFKSDVDYVNVRQELLNRTKNIETIQKKYNDKLKELSNTDEYKQLKSELKKAGDKDSKSYKEIQNKMNNFLNKDSYYKQLSESLLAAKKEYQELYVKSEQLKYQETRAGGEVYDIVSKLFGETILSKYIRKESARYDDSGAKAAETKRIEREASLQSANAFEKSWLKLQKATDWGLNTGFFGDEPTLLRAISKNFANLVTSNTEYLLAGIQIEADVLSKSSDLDATKTARLDVLNEALTTKTYENIIKAMDETTTTRFFENASNRAAEQYFKNSNWLSKTLSDIATKHPLAGEFISWVMPFPKVAANVLKMAYKYSPLGFMSTLSQWSKYNQKLKDVKGDYTIHGFEKADIIRSASQASVGTFMLLAGALAAALGWIDIDDDDYLGPSINLIGGVRIGLSDLAPSMTTFSTAAAMMFAYKNNKSVVSTALNTLYDNTLLGNIDNIFNYGGIQQFGENIAVSLSSQYVPSVLKLINNAILQSPQKDKTSSNLLEKCWKNLASGIPFVSNLVPDKVNPYTGEKVYSTGSSDWFLNMLGKISPIGIHYTYKDSELEREAKRLGSTSTGLSGKFKINGSDVVVTGTDKEKLAKFRANYISTEFGLYTSGKKLVTYTDDKTGKQITTQYSKLTDAQKKKAIESLYSKATETAKIEYWTSTGHKYVCTTQDSYNTTRKSVTNKSNVVYRTNWSKSKYVE